MQPIIQVKVQYDEDIPHLKSKYMKKVFVQNSRKPKRGYKFKKRLVYQQINRIGRRFDVFFWI